MSRQNRVPRTKVIMKDLVFGLRVRFHDPLLRVAILGHLSSFSGEWQRWVVTVRESSHAATGQHHLNQTFRYGISKSRRFLKIEWESGQRNEAPPTGWGRLCRLRNPVQMPTGAERDRSSVGGALELSGTGARSGWSADVRCEHPVGGPCVSGPMKVRHADQWSAGEQVGVHSGGPDLYCPACSLCKHRWPARTKSGGLVERAGCASRGVTRTGGCYFAASGCGVLAGPGWSSLTLRTPRNRRYHSSNRCANLNVCGRRNEPHSAARTGTRWRRTHASSAGKSAAAQPLTTADIERTIAGAAVRRSGRPNVLARSRKSRVGLAPGHLDDADLELRNRQLVVRSRRV